MKAERQSVSTAAAGRSVVSQEGDKARNNKFQLRNSRPSITIMLTRVLLLSSASVGGLVRAIIFL